MEEDSHNAAIGIQADFRDEGAEFKYESKWTTLTLNLHQRAQLLVNLS